ncbi:MAG: ArsB/NhaD family transporter [Candidatus Cloacimonadaceae bacterium]|nr:ArsB/NhaD family transporter [Candidatus Cloacimonadaceae bacterium]
MLAALLIFVITYVLIITEWINKMLAAMLGGFAIVLTRIVDQSDAFTAVDWNVIFFLIGMMMVISVLRQTGLFMYIAIKTAKLAKGNPIRIMTYMFLITAFVSAFLGSVTTIMILVPIILLIASELKISPVPFIITMVIASNMGGAATMIGDPPNILIGSATDYDFLDFFFNLTPPVVLITLSSTLLIILFYRKGMKVNVANRAKLMSYQEGNLIKDRKLLIRALVILFLMLLGLVLQGYLKLETATISMSAGLILLLLSNRKKVEHVIINDIDWVTIFFFIGLFMIVESLVKIGFIDMVAHQVVVLTNNEPRSTSMVILWMSGLFSSLIDNVPFVAAMIPMVEKLGTYINNPQMMHPIWWALSLGTCLGGNGTLIGASSNIVAVGIANRSGFHISFKEFTKIGAIFTLNAMLISTAYLLLRYF